MAWDAFQVETRSVLLLKMEVLQAWAVEGALQALPVLEEEKSQALPVLEEEKSQALLVFEK